MRLGSFFNKLFKKNAMNVDMECKEFCGNKETKIDHHSQEQKEAEIFLATLDKFEEEQAKMIDAAVAEFKAKFDRNGTYIGKAALHA